MKETIKNECVKNTKEESCGFLIFKKKRTSIFPCYNWANDRAKNFKIEAKEYIDASKAGEIFGVYHSHIGEDERFSEKDVLHSEEIMLPYFVYSLKTKGHGLYIPMSIKPKSKSFERFLSRAKREYSVIEDRG